MRRRLTPAIVPTHFRLASTIAAAGFLAAAWVGQASAFWPFGAPTRIELAPSYRGVCEGCDLSGRILTGARMSNSNFSRADFSGAVMARADASGSAFEEADFTDADLSSAKLADAICPRATFERAVLRRSDVSGADFTRADFTHADVSMADFAGAIIAGADLRTARGLTQAQLDHACGDEQTLLPRGLRVRRCD